MKACIHYLAILCILAAPTSYAAKDDFWQNCPGPACPANVPPDSEIGREAAGPSVYENMNKDQLDKEREKLEDSIKEIDREESRRGYR